VTRLGGGAANHVYCLDERYVVRLGTGPDGRCFGQSSAVLSAVAGRMAAPRLLHADLSRRRYPFNVMVCSYLPGESLFSLWDRLDPTGRMGIVSRVGPELDVLHSVAPDSVPCFVGALPWPQVARSSLDSAFAAAAGRGDGIPLSRLRDYVDLNWPAMESAPPAVILHNDVHWSNIIACDGRYAGLIDFDDTELGPPEIDAWGLAHFLAYSDRPGDLTPMSRPDAMRAAFALARRFWPGPLGSPGALARYTIYQIGVILGCLTNVMPWHTVEESAQEAKLIYHSLFEGPGAAYWLDS
jgi:aminoglycoside phosphotransferase (APT) family kinase protein